MSLTLGEKLQQAREARGLTISQVAEQTRISPLYLQCIENNDYRTLPGGIFNKGFVKSFAKFVGIDEQEALQDYANLAANQDNQISENPKTYRSEVLTDDQSRSSILTLVFAVIILGLMTWGILALVNYIQRNPKQQSAANTSANTTTASPSIDSNASSANPVTIQPASSLNGIKVEFKALKQPVSVTSTSDGNRASDLVTPAKPKLFEPAQNLRIAYSQSQSRNVQMTVNGKEISLPPNPLDPKRSVIEFEITNDNIKQILEGGAINAGNQAQTSVSPKKTPKK